MRWPSRPHVCTLAPRARPPSRSPPSSPRSASNFGLNLFWCYWWPASFLVYPFLGRVWCAGEPFLQPFDAPRPSRQPTCAPCWAERSARLLLAWEAVLGATRGRGGGGGEGGGGGRGASPLAAPCSRLLRICPRKPLRRSLGTCPHGAVCPFMIYGEIVQRWRVRQAIKGSVSRRGAASGGAQQGACTPARRRRASPPHPCMHRRGRPPRRAAEPCFACTVRPAAAARSC